MSILYMLFFIAAASARKLSEEEYFRLPKLYQLDDYEKCLSQKDGVYCVGTFHLTPETQPHAIYDLIKEHSEVKTKLNRTVIFRGYCVSERCPSVERNASLDFERCAAQWGSKHALRTTLHKLHYCRTHKDTQIVPIPNIWQRLFEFTIYIILAFNIIGTIYDITNGGYSKNKHFFMFWSIRSNWMRLTASYEDGDPRLSALTPINGGRIISILCIIWFHCTALHGHTFVHNPHALEQMMDEPGSFLKLNTLTGNQVLIVTSSFLTSFNLLLLSEKYNLSLKMLPIFILKRLMRIAPVYYLIKLYMVTWWPLANDGPLWPIFVTAQSKLCRRKFWAQMFFLNNIVMKHEHCLMPSWFLAADIHMCIVAVILTIWIVRLKRYVIPILVAAHVAITISIGVLVYVNNWSALLHKYTADNLRTIFQNDEAFIVLYLSSWTAIPSCLLGVIFAHKQYQKTVKGFNPADHKWLGYFQYLALPLLYAWLNIGFYLKEYTSPLSKALYYTAERPIFSLIWINMFYSLFNIDGPIRRFLSWRGFHPLARLSLPTVLVSWILNQSLMAGKLQPISTSEFAINIESLGLLSMSFLLALPLTILLEMPMGRFLDYLLAKSYFIGSEKTTTNKTVHVN